MVNQSVIVMDEKPVGEYDAIYFCGVSKKASTIMFTL